MRKKLIFIIILALITSFLSSCWNRREINDLSIAMGVGIDKTEEGYLVTVQLINPSDIAVENPSTRTGVTTYQANGKTVFEAFRKLTQSTPRKVYLSHLKVIVFGEDFAKDGIKKALDFFSRDHELRTDFYIMISKGATAKEILDVLSPLEKVPALNIYYALEMSEKVLASTYHIELDELINDLVSEGKNPVLTGVTLHGTSHLGTTKRNIERIAPISSIVIDNIAVFKNDKMVGWLNAEESKGYNFINDNIQSSVMNVLCDKGGLLSVEIIRSKTKLRANMKDETPIINISVIAEANIGEVQCDIDLLDTGVISEVEKKVEELIKIQMESAIKKTQKDYKSDIFGFGQAIHRKYPKVWKNIREDWSDYFSKLPVDIDIDVKIRRLGTITDSFQNKVKE